MTTNQLRWAELKENIRHNVVSERINARQAGASEVSAEGALLRGQAAMGQVDVGYQNVALGYSSLDFQKYQYDDTGREKISSETARNMSDVALKQAEKEVAEQQVKTLGAQATMYGAETKLKQAQRTKAYNDIATGYINALANMVGSNAKAADTIAGIVSSAGGAAQIAGQIALGF